MRALLFFAGMIVFAAPSGIGSVPSLHWMAPFLSGGGYCSEATSFALGLASRGRVRLSLEQHGDGQNAKYWSGLPSSERAVLASLLQPRGVVAPDVSICHSEPGAWHASAALPARWSTSRCPPEGARVRVGRTMFESDRLPEGWAARLNAMDHVWVPTAFSRDIFLRAGVEAGRVVVVPEPVDTAFFDPAAVALAVQASRRARGAAERIAPGTARASTYRFLSIGKFERRKNFPALLRAYLVEFARRDADAAAAQAASVELYILTSAYHSGDDFVGALQEMVRNEVLCPMLPGGEKGSAGGDPDILGCLPREALAPFPAPPQHHESETRDAGDADDDAAGDPLGARRHARRVPLPSAPGWALPPIFVLSDVPQTALPALYASCDAFVSTTRGEGWGRPHAEAMAMGLPTVATNWSGLTEFLAEGVAFPVRVASLAPIPEGAFRGHLQAEVDEAHLRSVLRALSARPEEGRAVGRAGRQRMVERYAPEVVAAMVEDIVTRIASQSAPGLTDADMSRNVEL